MSPNDLSLYFLAGFVLLDLAAITWFFGDPQMATTTTPAVSITVPDPLMTAMQGALAAKADADAAASAKAQTAASLSAAQSADLQAANELANAVQALTAQRAALEAVEEQYFQVTSPAAPALAPSSPATTLPPMLASRMK